jgi:class 3 adenylate cyclase/tetratricopeptide (TPR) repeat protein
MGCGAPLAPACPACGASNPPSARFCIQCGGSLTQPAPATILPSAPTASPETYTPRHLADKILASRAALQGERKQVTVLFADVVGSTELIQRRDAEEAQGLLDGVVQVMMDAVHRYEGTVSRLMGDGLMAMFGAPVAHEDHAVRACYAALAMQEAARRHADELRRSLGVTLTIRVGLCSGEVVVRTIRDDLHMDYTAMGQTVHLAARMEQLAEPGTIALAAETLALVEGYVQVRALGSVPVKGLDDSVEIYQLLGTGQARTRLQATAGRGLTRFVGRQAEMDALHGALERARAGHGQVAALVGEPGVGKSRLVWELTHSHRTEDWTILESGSVSAVYPDEGGGKATSYLPVIDLLKSYCRVESHDDERTIREKLLGKLLNLDEGLRPTLPALLTLLDVEVEDASWQALDPAQRRRQTLDAVKRLLLRESQEQPLLLVFEDLHWIDGETQALLDSLVEGLPTARILLLVNYRPEYRHDWGNRGYYTQLRIDPLAAESADELLAGLLGPDPSVEPLKALLAERTEGNPLFLEEIVRSLIESGLLAGERGAYRLAGPLTSVRVPATVQAVLAARIDRLPPDAKALLQTAAVIGKDVPDGVLRAVAGSGTEGLQRTLATLQAAEFLYEASLFPELEYTFKHALTHEVAYGSLLQDRRKALHARIVDAIEALHADRLAEHVERLAHHALRAEDWPRAVRYARWAGQKARARSAYREARAWLEEGLRAGEQLPDGRAAREMAVDIRLDLRSILGAMGADDVALVHLHKAEAIARELGDEERLRTTYGVMMGYFRSRAEYDRALEAGRRAQRLAEAAGDDRLEAFIAYQLARTHRELGELRQATEHFRSCLATLTSHPGLTFAGPLAIDSRFCQSQLAQALAELGDFDEAIKEGAEGTHVAESTEGLFPIAVAANILGLVHVLRGDSEIAIPLLEHGLSIAEAQQIADPRAWAQAILGAAYLLQGEWSRAVTLLEAAHETAIENALRAGLALWTIWRGEAYLAAGRLADARTTVASALAFTVEHRERGSQASALRVLGEIAARQEPPDAEAAEARYREALTLAEELDMRPLQARCHLGLGKLYQQMGRPDEARSELSTAAEMLREMGMTHWLPEAEAALKQVAGRLS